MVQASGPNSQDDRFFVFCRSWPGFTDRFPYNRFNSLPDTDIETVLEELCARRIASEDLLLLGAEEVSRRRELAGRARQAVLERIAKQSKRRRPCGDSAVRDYIDEQRKDWEAELDGNDESMEQRHQNRQQAADESRQQGGRRQRILQKLARLQWHHGRDSFAADQASLTLNAWGPNSWSQRIWVYAGLGGEAKAAYLVHSANELCQKPGNAIQVPGIAPELNSAGLSAQQSNARFGYVLATDITNTEKLDALAIIWQLARFDGPGMRERLLRSLQAEIHILAGNWELLGDATRSSQESDADESPLMRRDDNAVDDQEQNAGQPPQRRDNASTDGISWVDKAKILRAKHPEWSDAEIARNVGVSAGTVSRNEEYQEFKDTLLRSNVGDVPRGRASIREDGSRFVEAYSDDDDPAEKDWD